MLAAARQQYGARRIVAAWEPHTFSRVRALCDAFTAAFAEADAVVVLPIYAARERDDGGLTAQGLARAIAHPNVVSVDSLDGAVAHLVAASRPGDVVLLMGAGDEYLVGQRLVEALRRHWQVEGSKGDEGGTRCTATGWDQRDSGGAAEHR